MNRLALPTLAACGLTAVFATCAYAQDTAPAKAADGVLVGPTGMALYTFDRDSAGKSACNGPCVTTWPPLAAPASANASGDWTVVQRDDGKAQWAYKGKPLYYWAKDAKPGEHGGDGFNNVWHVARP